MKKYKFTDEIKKLYYGITLHRIIAVEDFGNVKAGELGGWIQSQNNLSHEGKSWISGEAKVLDNAVVKDDAVVKGNAIVFGKAIIYENAVVSGDSSIHDNAKVYGKSLIDGRVKIFDNAHVFGISHIGGRASVHDNAHVFGVASVIGLSVIGGNANLIKSPINLINVCPFDVTAYDDMIQIGCELHDVEYWKSNYERHRDQCFSNEDFEQCKKALFYCIDLLKSW